MEISISVTHDLATFIQRLSNIMKIAETTIGSTVAMSILPVIEEASPVDTGYFQSRWRPGLVGIDGGVSFGNDAPYARVLEEGLYPPPRPGGKTVAYRGRVYSSQAVGGILSPFVENESNINRITEMVYRSIMEFLGRA